MARYASENLKKTRKDEIVDACEKLYKTMSFKEITMKEISDETSFTRTSIYNYFHTKEEIFLSLFAREYDEWVEDLQNLYTSRLSLSVTEFAEKISETIEKRGLLLKLLSMNMFDMEENSREENLSEFKKSYGNSIKAVYKCLDRLSPRPTERKKESFIYSFFPFMYGLYPYTSVTEKQKSAMEKANVGFIYHSVYDLTFRTVKTLLSEEI